MTEAAAASSSSASMGMSSKNNNIDLKPPPSRPRPRNASDASDFQLFETASTTSSIDQQQQQQQYQHSPPNLLSTSYEAANRKRLRSGSVSGRLRSASEYLEEKGLLDRQTKGIMKDLIIIGDEELQAAIDRYEQGDPSVLEQMIQSGALQNRLPKDLDILGDLDLDFLTMDESSLLPMHHPPLHHADDDETAAHQLQQLHHSSMISPDDEDDDDGDNDEEEDEYDDIGELDFHSDDYDHDRITSDSPTPELSEHERRMRSNSLYSALINNHGNTIEASSYGRWMDPDQAHNNRNQLQPMDIVLPTPTHSEATNTKDEVPIKIRKKKGRRPKTASNIQESNLTKSLRDSAEKKVKRTPKQPKPRKTKNSKQTPDAATSSAATSTTTTATIEEPVHILGRPRSWSDPQLSVTVDEDGLRNVERPDGWVGAYSPDSRKERIRQFLTKRNLRVWTKSVKYNVRKDFANSRLRVKGRFVKKEDETLMRELMSLT